MKIAISVFSISVLLTAVVGCGSSQNEDDPVTNTSAPIVMDEMPPLLDDAHDHPDHGPHGGELVELGKEAFHAELVHGDEGISIYVLDGSATKTVAIAADKLVVSLKHDGQVNTFDLAARPDAEDAAGLASRFVSSDQQLDEWLDAGAEGAVVVQIEGKSYNGKVVHDHNHEGHSH